MKKIFLLSISLVLLLLGTSGCATYPYYNGYGGWNRPAYGYSGYSGYQGRGEWGEHRGNWGEYRGRHHDDD